MCRSLEEFCSLLSEITRCFGKMQDPWRSRFLCGARMDPLHLLNPSKNQFICQHITNAVLLASNTFRDTAHFIYRLHWSPMWVEISMLAYEMNTNYWPEWISVAYCTHIVHTNAQKWEISIKIDVYSYRRAHRHASCSAGVFCRGCGAVSNMQHTAINLLKTSWVPSNSWNFI